jgi:hypothetical protein
MSSFLVITGKSLDALVVVAKVYLKFSRGSLAGGLTVSEVKLILALRRRLRRRLRRATGYAEVGNGVILSVLSFHVEAILYKTRLFKLK